VGIEDLADGGELAVEIAQRWHQRQELDHGERDEDGDRPGEERGTGGHARTAARRPQPPPDECGEPAELPVVEQEEGERDRQVVEEGVVPGEEDRYLHTEHGDEDAAAHQRRPVHQERETELDDVDVEAAELVCPERHLVRVPANPGRERSGLVVGRHRREIAPGWVAEEPLRCARLDVQAEEQPEYQEDGDRVWSWGVPGMEAARRYEEREEGRLEEQIVPLEGEEVLPDRDEG